jgi:hypothetical protein
MTVRVDDRSASVSDRNVGTTFDIDGELELSAYAVGLR